jgi:hypothetical protein
VGAQREALGLYVIFKEMDCLPIANGFSAIQNNSDVSQGLSPRLAAQSTIRAVGVLMPLWSRSEQIGAIRGSIGSAHGAKVTPRTAAMVIGRNITSSTFEQLQQDTRAGKYRPKKDFQQMIQVLTGFAVTQIIGAAAAYKIAARPPAREEQPDQHSFIGDGGSGRVMN